MNFDAFLERPEVGDLKSHFEQVLSERCRPGRHGDLPNWLKILDELPQIPTKHIKLDTDTVQLGLAEEADAETLEQLDAGLRALSPWRKGPFQLFNSFIDTEWRSDWKWQRVQPHIHELSGKHVLDVGCGTGYHAWRMLGAGANQVLGIDPSMRFLVQYLAIQKYAQDSRFDFLPIGIEDMPRKWPIFDTVFSMGVLYHRRTPSNHIAELTGLLKPGGQLVLETLIIDEVDGGVFTPEGRYAQMRNVWSITTVDKTLELLTQAGLKNARCVDQNVTSLEEQRRTQWMQFHSLAEFLDPQDQTKTIEGHPAPKRGIFLAEL